MATNKDVSQNANQNVLWCFVSIQFPEATGKNRWSFPHSKTLQENVYKIQSTYLKHKQLLAFDSHLSGGREAPGIPFPPM